MRGFSEKAFRAHPKVKVMNLSVATCFYASFFFFDLNYFLLGEFPFWQEFYRILESPTSTKNAYNEGNFSARHHDEIDDLGDPFETVTKPQEKTPLNPRSSVPSNPYFQQKRSCPSFADNPYQKLHSWRQRSFHSTGPGPVPQSHTGQQEAMATTTTQHSHPCSTPQSNDISHTLTQEQLNRMEENRLRALAIRMKRQRNS